MCLDDYSHGQKKHRSQYSEHGIHLCTSCFIRNVLGFSIMLGHSISPRFLLEIFLWRLTISLLLTHQQVRQLEEEKTHSQQRAEQAQQRIREVEEENHCLQQQVSLLDHCYVDSDY